MGIFILILHQMLVLVLTGNGFVPSHQLYVTHVVVFKVNVFTPSDRLKKSEPHELLTLLNCTLMLLLVMLVCKSSVKFTLNAQVVNIFQLNLFFLYLVFSFLS